MEVATTKPKARRVKPAGKLAAVADANKAPSQLLGDVKKYLLSKHGEDDGRRSDVMHPSEMAKADYCSRKSFYQLSETPTSDSGEKFNFYMENIFDEGHAIHGKWQDRLADMGILWGDWVCRRCDALILATDGPVCPICSASWPNVKYKEVRLSHEPQYRVAGKADGIVITKGVLLEIKSIGIGTLRMELPSLLRNNVVEEDGKKVYDLDGIWKGIRRPFTSHVKQANIYAWMARHQGIPVDKIVFIYEFKGNQQVKEFTVPYSDAIMAPIIDSMEDVQYALTTGVPPVRPEYAGQDTKMCKDCEFRSTCYGTTSTTDTKPDARVRRRRIAGQAEAGTAGPGDASQAGVRHPRTAGRPHRSVRQPVDVPVQPDEPMDGVHGSPTGGSRGRRKILGEHP